MSQFCHTSHAWYFVRLSDFSASLPRSPPALQFATDGGRVQLFAQENQVLLGNDQPTSLHPSPPAAPPLMPSISPEVSKGSRT